MAHHFSNKKEVAIEFVELVAGSDRNTDDRIIPALLSFQNPLVVDACGKGWVSLQDILIQTYKEGVYDSAIFKNVSDSAFDESVSDTYIAFSPDQILMIENLQVVALPEPLEKGRPQKAEQESSECLTIFA